VAAFEIGNPVADVVEVETNDPATRSAAIAHGVGAA
jgi:hypothetical protein